MKTYTLSLDIFNHQDELVETIEFLKSQYPMLLEDRVHEYIKAIKNYHSGSYEGLARNRFAIIMAFSKKYGDNDNRKARELYEVQGREREELLARTYTVNHAYLEKNSVDIEAGLSNGLLVEINYISFTSQEVNYIKQNLANPELGDSVVFNSIINKLNE